MQQQTSLPSRAEGSLAPQHPETLDSVAVDVAWLRVAFVNVAFLGAPDAGDRGWLLVDTGLPGTARTIQRAAERRYGVGIRPAGILLTHSHLDHIGGVQELAAFWDCPVYAHPAEHRFLTGRAVAAPVETGAQAGILAAFAEYYPLRPLDLTGRLRALPGDGSLPELEGWRWLATPGHSAGHIALWRAEDRLLLCGDALTTLPPQQVYGVPDSTDADTRLFAAETPDCGYRLAELPLFFDCDDLEAQRSLRQLAALEPEVLLPMHGPPMRGEALRCALTGLVRHSNENAAGERFMLNRPRDR